MENNNIETGFARNTASLQTWLNTTECVTEWRELNEDWIEFRFSRDVECAVVPAGVHFDTASMTFDELEGAGCI